MAKDNTPIPQADPASHTAGRSTGDQMTTSYTTSINTAATAVSSATTTWQDDATRLATSPTARPLVWLEMDKWGQWKVIDLRPGAVPQ